MQDIAKKEQTQPTIPGIGVSGMVMCPFFKGACLKQGCELWVELNAEKTRVARCSFAWLSVLTTEITGEIKSLKETLKSGNAKSAENVAK